MKDLKVLELHDASISQAGTEILRDVTLSMVKGEFAYLIGKTGAGKSSLLKTLYGDLPLSEGSGKVGGFNLLQITRSTVHRLRRQLGIVFQDFNLLTDRTVEQNLRFVLRATGWKDKARIRTRIEEVLTSVQLPGILPKMPHELSGGEQQRVVIARALLNQPQIILADEPTGNLDPDTSDEIVKLIRQLAADQQTAVLFATHDYRILEQFPARIIRCHGGKVFDEERVRY
jgi:cell division transport system ATP-binding protein